MKKRTSLSLAQSNGTLLDKNEVIEAEERWANMTNPYRFMIPRNKFVISREDQEILRRLAGQVAQLAARPIENEKRDLWFRHNALEATRPLIWCMAGGAWKEIITETQIQCQGELAREWEIPLRREIFWGESMGDDRVIEPYFEIPYIYEESDFGMHATKVGGQNGGAYTWESPLKSYDDLSKLHFPSISVDYEATNSLLSLAKKVLGDLLTVRLKGIWFGSLGMTTAVVSLRGLQQIMFDAYDYPEEFHQLMGILRDGTMAKLDFLEKNALLSLNNDGTKVGSGGFGYTRELPQKDFDGKTVRTYDMWGFCESQETVGFSPDMFAEFFFSYQLPLLERFGLNCYGCCEPLDKRWHVIRNTPRLRRVSVSAWANQADMADKLGDQYIYSMKLHPLDMTERFLDEERIRTGLRRAFQITRNCRVELIFSFPESGNTPQNVRRWCQIAHEEAEAI